MNVPPVSRTKSKYQGGLCPKTRQVGGGLHVFVIIFLWPFWLLSQGSDCWYPVSENGQSGFVNQRGELAFPLQPYHFSGIRRGLFVANNHAKDDGGWIRQVEPLRIAPVFPHGNSGLMNMKGEWVLPIQSQVIGYMGFGIWWACSEGQIKRYCTEDPHIEGGKYALVNASGVLLDSLDDIALGFVDGCTPVFRAGKIALMDTSGRLRTGFVFDKAISNHLGSHRYDAENPDDRLWKLALRRESGGWVVVQGNGSLTEVDWPQNPVPTERGVGWRKQASLWIVCRELVHLPCRMDLHRRRLELYKPKDLSYAENFPTDAFLEAKCKEQRASSLREIGLKVLEKNGRRALATLKGKPLTPFGYDYFEARKGGFVAFYHTELPLRKTSTESEDADSDDGWDTFGGAEKPDEPQTKVGLLDGRGKEVLPPHFAEIDVHPESRLIDGNYGNMNAFYDYGGKQLDMGLAPSLGWADSGYFAINSYHGNKIFSPQMEVLVEDSNELGVIKVEDNWLWYVSGRNAYFGMQLDGDSTLGPLHASEFPEAPDRWLFQLPYAWRDSAYYEPAVQGCWKIDLNGRAGLIDSTGKLVVPLAYDGVAATTEWIEVRRGNLFGLLDWSGKEIIPVAYTQISWLGCDLYSLVREENGKSMQCIQDLNGKRRIWGWKEE